ncbi:MAG: hypothetical protein V7785_24800 [Bermanella sp.]
MNKIQDQNQAEEAQQDIKTVNEEQHQANTRRNFIKKYGALAAITPVAMSMTMHSKKALAYSCTECAP